MRPNYDEDAVPILPFSRPTGRFPSSSAALLADDDAQVEKRAYGDDAGAYSPASDSEDSLFPPSPPLPGALHRAPPAPKRTPRWRAWALLALAFVVGLLFGTRASRGADADEGGARGQVLPGLWSAYGDDALSPVGTRESVEELPVCERTMLVEWSSFNYGLGSGIVVTGLIAKMHNYTLVFEEGINPYGSYYAHFEPAPTPGCRVTQALRNPATYRVNDGNAALLGHLLTKEKPSFEVNRVLAGWESMVPIAQYTRAATFSMPDLASLPPLDSQRPFPLESNVPPLFHERFLQYSALMREHFSFNTLLSMKVRDAVIELKLGGKQEVPVVGVHYRGGDKLVMDGNITLHCETAYDSLLSPSLARDFPSFDPSTHRARLLLMTTEPTAFSLFTADAFCARHFAIEELPRGGTGKSFVQSDFWALSAEQREEDSARMLVQADILANYVDAAVVSANSNTGRTLVFLRGGPQRVLEEQRIRSVDVYWHPTNFPPFKGKCDGTIPVCWPNGP
ncbi:hypothetical protein JCM10450v2_007649 [Rhodotorula kratochvilovae]